MSRVVSLVGFGPPPRYDAVAWTDVQVQEAAAPAGPWVAIDEQSLVPLDVDPAVPQARNVTTALATLELGWYRIVFFDGDGNQSEPSDPVRSAAGDEMLPPTPDQVRISSPLLRQKFPIPAVDPFAAGDLRNLVYNAVALVQAETWRTIDPSLGCPAPEGEVCELVPDSLIPVALQAVTLMSERLRVTSDPAFAEQAATGRRLRGFSAGPYSESYFAPGEFARRGAQQGRPAMDADDALDAALWALATEAARDYFVFRATGKVAPAGVASVFDIRRQSLGYSAGMRGRGVGRAGPDGW